MHLRWRSPSPPPRRRHGMRTCFRRIAPRAMRPSSLDHSCETRPRTCRPFVIITTDIKSIAICQRSSAGTPPTTAAGHEPSRASQMCETADPTQLRLEGRHARTHVAESVVAIERQTNGRSERHTKAFGQSPADGLRGSRVRRLPRGERSPRVHCAVSFDASGSAFEDGGFMPADVLDWIARGAPTRVS